MGKQLGEFMPDLTCCVITEDIKGKAQRYARRGFRNLWVLLPWLMSASSDPLRLAGTGEDASRGDNIYSVCSGDRRMLKRYGMNEVGPCVSVPECRRHVGMAAFGQLR